MLDKENVGKDMARNAQEPLCSVDGNVNWHLENMWHLENNMGVPQKTKKGTAI